MNGRWPSGPCFLIFSISNKSLLEVLRPGGEGDGGEARDNGSIASGWYRRPIF